MVHRATSVALLALLAVVALLPAALAFSSLAAGASEHELITEAGARAAGFPAGGLAALQAASIAPDLEEMEWDPDTGKLARIDATGGFRAEHHCDRVPPSGHLPAFNATVSYVQQTTAAAANASHAGDAEAAVRLLGAALHAAQDCSSHSNAVDLGIEADFPSMVLGMRAPPAGLWLTGFLPGADDPEMPPDDPYPHGSYAKDSAGSTPEAEVTLPDGRSKFEVARSMAEATTALLLQGVLSDLSADEVAALGEVEPPAVQVPKVPAPPVIYVLAALALAMAVAHRRLSLR